MKTTLTGVFALTMLIVYGIGLETLSHYSKTATAAVLLLHVITFTTIAKERTEK